jgi:hypothetical protein
LGHVIAAISNIADGGILLVIAGLIFSLIRVGDIGFKSSIISNILERVRRQASIAAMVIEIARAVD